jgi:ribA/ribD-fused uncharacterized protein
MKETNTHIYFWGSIYSQWYKISFKDGSILFSSAEQFMMYSKAMLFSDKIISKQILETNDQEKQKDLGKKAQGFKQDIWDAHKFEIVVKGNLLKFTQNESLKKQLLATGDKILVEGSPFDKIWGVGLKWNDPRILNESNWQGENLLGKALMVVRKILRANDARDIFYKDTI